MTLDAKIEGFLFIAPRPLTVKHLAQLTESSREEVEGALNRLMTFSNVGERGIRIVRNGDTYQMTTAPEHAAAISAFIKEDIEGDLTRPQLEALTVIAYRGPITKRALEHVRGVNCTLILRNLLLRGLVETADNASGEATYTVSMDCLRTLGVPAVTELPEYETLHAAEEIDRLLEHVQEHSAS